jgi:hypothetical protein
MEFTSLSLVALACVGLTACGGTTKPMTLVEIDGAGASLASKMSSTDYTVPSILPISGSATYNGFADFEVMGVLRVGGDLEMTADFRLHDALSGRVYNLVSADEIAFDGELALNNSIINRDADVGTGSTYEVDMTGTLTDEDSRILVDATLIGDFKGPNYEFLEGRVAGIVGIDGALATITDGQFVAEKQ